MFAKEMLIDAVGWLATLVVFSSFFFRNPTTLRLVQLCGAVLWTLYGIVIGSLPVIVANVLICTAAIWTARRARTGDGLPVSAADARP